MSDAGALPEAVGPQTGWIVPRDDVAALAAALESAHREHAAGVLKPRGAGARQLMEQAFERTRCSSAVADVIEAAAHPGQCERTRDYSVFCEARFGRHQAGAWATTDTAGDWERYVRYGDRLRLVARANPRPGSGVVPLPSGVRVAPVPYYVGLRQLVGRSVAVALSILRAVRTAETIILRLPGTIGSIAAAACLLLRRRYAVELVGDPYDVLAAGVLGRGGRLAASAAAAYTRWVVRRADAVLYVTREQLQERYPPGRRAVTSGVSNVVLGPDAFLPRPRRWSAGRPRIVAIGSQEQHYKGHDVLLRAVRRLLDSGRDVDAVIVGGGRLHGEIRALARSLGVDGRVELTGAIHDRASLVEVLDSATVFAMPSRTEGLPRALVEAMARGLPAVGTDVGGIPELLESRWTVPAGDDRALGKVLADLLDDPDAWEAQSRRNLEVARGYRDDQLRQKFETWLHGVPAASPKQRPWCGATR